MLALAAGPAWGAGLEICAPNSARQAYDAIVAAAPDGSKLEEQARQVADDARARGTFESDDTISRLDELARSADYRWDCEGQAYRYDAPEDDPSGEDEAVVPDPAGADSAAAEPAEPIDTAPAGPEQAPEGPTSDASAVPGGAAASSGPGASSGAGASGGPATPPSPGANRPPAQGAPAASAAGPGRTARNNAVTRAARAGTTGDGSARGSVGTGSPGGDRGRGSFGWMAGGSLAAALAVLVWRHRR
ncbi:MAG TPA: hypothetical protein VGO87_04715 [Acidimicrobiia bacterium]